MTDFWDSFEIIDLADLGQEFNLQTRVDRKYLVPKPALLDAISEVQKPPKVIAVNHQLRTEYSSIYFDTANFDFHRAAATSRRNRFKIRFRKYDETKNSFLEIKLKTARQMTEKIRVPVPYEQTELNSENISWINSEINNRGFNDLSEVSTSLVNSFNRRTLLLSDGSRFTVDSDLKFEDLTAFNSNDWRILETKSLGRKSDLDSSLWRLGFRPIRVSKYSIGICLKHSNTPRNKWTVAIDRAFKEGDYAKNYSNSS